MARKAVLLYQTGRWRACLKSKEILESDDFVALPDKFEIHDDWHSYRNDALKRIAADFLEEEGIPYSGDDDGS